MSGKIVLVAGATGNLGGKIVQALIQSGAEVRAIVRADGDPVRIETLVQRGPKIIKIHNWNLTELTKACEDVSCVVSALAGLEEVVLDAQKMLFNAAVNAGVKRFIPSDYSIDFTQFSTGENRNLDLRREFHMYIKNAPIAVTSIFNGAFMDLLVGEMPLILLKQKKILYWGDRHHKLWFTTVADTAQYTARVAMEDESPRYLRIAGDLKSPKEIQAIMSEVTGKPFKRLHPGGQALLGFFIKMAKIFAPGKGQLYPAWQGMQYMHNMIDARGTIQKTDNDRYPELKWTGVKGFLEKAF